MGEFTNGVIGLTIAGPTTTYIATNDQGLPTGNEVSGSNTGQLYRQQLSLLRMDPVFNFTLGSLGALLDLVPLNGQCVGAGFTVLAASMIARKLGTCDDPLGGTPHYQTACSKGLLILESLRASRDADLTISGMCHTFTDGAGGSPIAITDGVAWPATVIEQRYRLGLCKIAGVTFPEVEEISINFGISILPKSPQLGYIWTKTTGVITVNPVLTLRGRDLAKVKTGIIELVGNSATSANSLLQFLKVLDGATFESFASSLHTTMLITGLVVPTELQSASAGSRATNELVLTTKSVSGAAPIVIDTTATYNINP